MRLARTSKSALSIAAVIAVMLGLALLLLGAPGVSSQTLRRSWNEVDLSGIVPSSVRLSQVQLADSTTAWLLGNETITPGSSYRGWIYKLRWQDEAWYLSERYSFPYATRELTVAPDGTLWAVASGYTQGVCCNLYSQILRKDLSGWHVETERLEGVFIDSLLILPGGQEAWAAGGKLIDNCKFTCSEVYLLHYKNGSWVRDATATHFGRYLASVDFAGGVGYAVGEAILKYDGQAWSKVNWPQLPPVPTAPPHNEPCPGLYFACLSFERVRALGPDEFWTMGRRYSTLSEADAEPVLWHMNHGRWQVIMPGNAILEQRPSNSAPLKVSDFTMASDGFGFLAASPKVYWIDGAFPQIIEVSPDGSLSYEQIPQIEHTIWLSISNTDADHALALGLRTIQVPSDYGFQFVESPVLLSYIDEGPAPTPTPEPPTGVAYDKHYLDGTYFPQVGHNLRGGFLTFWAQHGGLSQFGYPLTEEFTETSPTDGKSYTVQYFERARMEWHPENSPPDDVQLGLLGCTITRGRESEPPFLPVPFASSGGTWFAPTRHALAEPFLSYWQQRGGLAIYGYPISEAFTETSPTDGKPYLVQYFERNRFELHPEFAEASRVSLGLLGTQVLKARGWIR